MRPVAVFLAHLAKEIRDARAMLIGIPLVITGVLALGAAVVPSDVVMDPAFPLLSGAACLVLWMLGIASDLVPGESRRGTLAFLARMPSGLGAAFAAKVTVLLGSGALLVAFGFAAGSAVAATLGGDFQWPDRGMETLLVALRQDRDLWPLARLGLAALAGWTFAVSCWLPRGSLALPSAALLLATLGLPFWLTYGATPGFLPPQEFVLAIGAGLAIVSVPVAWLSFVRGRRLGRGVASGAWRGLLATVVLVAPAWAYAAVDCEDWNDFDPVDDRCEMWAAYVGSGGRYVFVNATVKFAGRPALRVEGRSRRARRSFVVDLETGRWSDDLGPGHRFLPVGEMGRAWWYHRRTTPVPVVARLDEGASGEGRHWVRYYDGATGGLIQSGWSHLRYEEVERLEPRSRRARLEGYRALRPAGLGDVLYRDRERFIHDPFRGRVYPASRFTGLRGFLVRPGQWLAVAEYGRRGEIVLLDPDTGGVSLVPGARMPRCPILLDDGRVLGLDPARGTLVLRDPEATAGLDLGVEATWCSRLARTPDGAYVLWVKSRSAVGEDSVFHARLDVGTGALRRFPALDGLDHRRCELIAVLDETTLLCLLDRHRIVRVECGRSDLEILFPRAD